MKMGGKEQKMYVECSRHFTEGVPVRLAKIKYVFLFFLDYISLYSLRIFVRHYKPSYLRSTTACQVKMDAVLNGG